MRRLFTVAAFCLLPTLAPHHALSTQLSAFASCDASDGTVEASRSFYDTCSSHGAEIESLVRPTEVRTQVDVGPDAEPSAFRTVGYVGGGYIRDRLIVTPDDPSRNGERATLFLTIDLNGLLPHEPSNLKPYLSVQVRQSQFGQIGVLPLVFDVRSELFDRDGNALGSATRVDRPDEEVRLINESGQDARLTATLKTEMEIVLGQNTTYEMFFQAGALLSNQLVEIVSYSGITELSVLDQFGAPIDVTLDAVLASNINDLLVAPIPVPAALPLFASAIAVFGWLGWRRRRASA